MFFIHIFEKKIMKNTILLLLALTSLSTFSQSSITAKQEKKIIKKLDLNIVNRGFVNESSIILFQKIQLRNSYKKLWEDALFEAGISLGTVSDNKTNSRWQLEILHGGYSGIITDIENDHKTVLKFSSDEGMNIIYYGKNTKRSKKFKNYVKVIFAEIMKSIKK